MQLINRAQLESRKKGCDIYFESQSKGNMNRYHFNNCKYKGDE